MTARRIRKKPVDRSPKARSPLSRIEAADAKWRQLGNVGIGPQEAALHQILREAGVQDANVQLAATECLVKCGFNSIFKASEGLRLADERRDLHNLIATAETFAEQCRCLALTTRNRLLDEPALPSAPQRDAYAAGKVAEGVARVARAALAKLPVDRGGAPGKDRFKNTVFGLAVVWNKYAGVEHGVGRSGKRAFWQGESAEYKGPLFDFVVRVLDLEGIRYTSRAALGATLLDVAERARRRAATSSGQNDELQLE